MMTILMQGLRAIGAGVCNLIYWLISKLFQLFMIVSQLNILSSDEIGPIYERITLILTIVMVFYITFEFVKYVVQPDTMTDKEKGVSNIVKRMIIAIVLIAFVPRIFTGAYDLQNRLITNQVFSKIILGEQNINFDTFGSAFSADMLGVFYSVDEEYCSGSDFDTSCQEAQENVENNLKKLREGGKVTFMPGLNKTKKFEVDGSNEDVFPVKFDGLLAIIVGGVILYLVILYTIDVGTRYAQLIFLQIMSPIAIIGYISPKKDNIFSKWLKQCITTYLDLFIRLTIIYFILLIIDVLGDSFQSGSLFAGIEGVEGYKNLAYIALIMGLLVFAQKAPKMIGELLPGGGAASIGYGLKGGDRFTPTVNGVKKTWNAGKRTVGGAAGAIGGVYKGFKEGNKHKAWSALKAGYQGLKAGAGKGGGIRKGLDAARGSVQKDLDIQEAGGDPWTADVHGGREVDRAKVYDRETARYEAVQKAKGTVGNSVKELKARQFVEGLKETDAAKGDAALLDRLGGDVKAVEKASRAYAVVRDGGDPQKAAAAYKTLETTIKSSMLGTGFYQGDKNNSLVLSTMKDANGKLIDTKAMIRDGTLGADKIDSLKTTTTLTDSLKTIMKKSRADRTTDEQQQIEAFITVHEQHTAEIDKFVADKIEKDNPKWSTVKSTIIAATTATKDIPAVHTYVDSDGNSHTEQLDIEYKDSSGNVHRVAINQLADQDLESFAKEIGTIDDVVTDVINKRKNDKSSKEMHANAQASGKSGK